MEKNEEKKAIIVATIVGFITSFEMNNIKLLQQLGYQVSCATNLDKDNHPDKIELLKNSGVRLYHIPFSRAPFTKQNIRAYKELRKLMHEEQFDLIHCHTPVGGVLGRMAAHKEHVPCIIYTAHGFHFYDGAPLKNWLVFYPIEKYLSRYTDVLVTINKEDYKRATEKFHAKKTAYVPGVGVDIDKFAPRQSGRERIRAELGLKDTDTMLLSVGELNENKNHTSVIKALSGSNLTYVVVGKGDKETELNALAKEYAVDLRLTGYRNDVADFYDAADVYILPSIREGLNVSLMEAMASGLPVACGRIRGNVDLIADEDCLFNPTDVKGIEKAIQYVLENKKKLSQTNLQKIKSFDLSIVKEKASEIYAGGGVRTPETSFKKAEEET